MDKEKENRLYKEMQKLITTLYQDEDINTYACELLDGFSVNLKAQQQHTLPSEEEIEKANHWDEDDYKEGNLAFHQGAKWAISQLNKEQP